MPKKAAPNARSAGLRRSRQSSRLNSAQAASRTDRKLAQMLKNQISAIVDSCDDAIIAKTLDGIIVAWSPGAERIYGYAKEEVIGKPVSMLIPPERADELGPIMKKIRGGERVDHFETERVRKDGRRITVSVTISPILDAGGKVLGAAAVARDITGKKRVGQATRQREAHLHLLVEQVPVIIWTTDTQLRIISSWGSALAALGLKPRHLVGKTLQQLWGTNDPVAPSVASHLQALAEMPAEFDTERDGRAFHVRVEPLRGPEAKIIGCIGVAVDITERKKAEERVRYLATHDPLTDLANYRALLDAFDTELHRSDRTGRPFAVLLLDLDGLKRINDHYGHLVGSRALCRLANILKRQCRSIDMAARYGGDEFAVLLVETEKPAALAVATRIADQLAKGTEVPPLSVSVGVAVYPTDGKTTEALLAAADRALYAMKMNSFYKSNRVR